MGAIGPIEGTLRTEISYVEYTALVSIDQTTEGTAVAVVAAPALVCDGTTPIWIEFFCSRVVLGANAYLIAMLCDGGSSIGSFATMNNSAVAADAVSCLVRRKLTPAAGSHTFAIKAYSSILSYIVGGAGGDGVEVPGYIRITRG